MFRIQDNVPQIYINESRDFQLISRLYDLMYSGVKYDIDSMVNILDATLIQDNLLELMCSKVGFFPRIKIDSDVLKYIIASFPYIIKNKGNKRGIEYSVSAILKSQHGSNQDTIPYIVMDNYAVQIYTNYRLEQYLVQILNELLRYVLPTGVNAIVTNYSAAFNNELDAEKLTTTDKINIIGVKGKLQGQIMGSSTSFKVVDTSEPENEIRSTPKVVSRLVGAYDTHMVVGNQTPNEEKVKVYINEQQQ